MPLVALQHIQRYHRLTYLKHIASRELCTILGTVVKGLNTDSVIASRSWEATANYTINHYFPGDYFEGVFVSLLVC